MSPTQLTLECRHAEWSAAFEAERARVSEALGPSIDYIDHAGSTSIPGVPAKPVLDILIAVSSFEVAQECVSPMTNLGYEYRGEYGIPRRRYFVRGEPRTHHVHMLEAGSPAWDEMLQFRNFLRSSAAARRAYAEEKKRLARQCPDKDSYQAAKDTVVTALLRRAPVATKACPVVLRGREILAFEHPLAGIQLVKGTIEPGERASGAALRELREETGIQGARLLTSLGTWDSGRHGVWAAYLCRAGHNLPDRWIHHAADGGGLDFQFFWQRLEEKPSSRWHPAHVSALDWICSQLSQ